MKFKDIMAVLTGAPFPDVGPASAFTAGHVWVQLPLGLTQNFSLTGLIKISSKHHL